MFNFGKKKIAHILTTCCCLAVAGCSPDSAGQGDSQAKVVEETLLCEYTMKSVFGRSNGEKKTRLHTIKKTDGVITEVNDSNYNYLKEKTIVRTDVSPKDGSKHPALTQLVVDDKGIRLLLEVTVDKFTHEAVIDKSGNYFNNVGLATLEGTCRSGKAVF